MSDVKQEGGPRWVNTVVRQGRSCSTWTGSRSPPLRSWTRSGGSRSRLWPPRWAARPAAPKPSSMLAARSGCGTGRSAAARWVLAWRKRVWRRYVTGLVDLAAGRLLDVIADRTRRADERFLRDQLERGYV